MPCHARSNQLRRINKCGQPYRFDRHHVLLSKCAANCTNDEQQGCQLPGQRPKQMRRPLWNSSTLTLVEATLRGSITDPVTTVSPISTLIRYDLTDSHKTEHTTIHGDLISGSVTIESIRVFWPRPQTADWDGRSSFSSSAQTLITARTKTSRHCAVPYGSAMKTSLSCF
jgi:hypothetical protein